MYSSDSSRVYVLTFYDNIDDISLITFGALLEHNTFYFIALPVYVNFVEHMWRTSNFHKSYILILGFFAFVLFVPINSHSYDEIGI